MFLYTFLLIVSNCIIYIINVLYFIVTIAEMDIHIFKQIDLFCSPHKLIKYKLKCLETYFSKGYTYLP